MTRRIGFRHVLPVLFTLGHVAILFYASVPQLQVSDIASNRLYHPTVYQNDSAFRWEPRLEPKPLNPAQKLAILLNLPALIAAVPIVMVFFPGRDIATLYASLPFVPLVWYGIGRWVDGLLGYISASSPRRGNWRRLFAVLSLSLLCLGIIMLTPASHHRTENTYWVGFATTLWSGLFLAISVSGCRRRVDG